MKGALALRQIVGTPVVNDCSATTITAAAYVEMSAVLAAPASAIEVFNTSAKAIKLAIGTAGNEVDLGFWVPPATVGMVIPVVIKNALRLTAKALTADATTGFLVVNFLE